ncbi:MAG: dockerin type I repeat-containing protein [Oscillospiraceae bacterium]|nr:dockerin type I repeat-containing protein [Oscillospiraceae bacterium]
MKKILFSALFISAFMLNSAVFPVVRAVDNSSYPEDLAAILNTEKYKSFQVYEDTNGVFEKKYDKNIKKDHDLVLLYTEDNKPGYGHILYKASARIGIKVKNPEEKKTEAELSEVRKLITDFFSAKGISAEKIEIDGYTNIAVTSPNLDVITKELADELCCYLTEKGEISRFTYRDQCYFASELSTHLNGYLLYSENEQKIADLVAQNKIDATVTAQHPDSGSDLTQVRINGSNSVKSYIDLAEIIYRELGYNPLYGLYETPVDLGSPFEIVFSNENSSFVSGDIILSQSVDTTDLTALSLALIGDVKLSTEQIKAADVDGDGNVTIADLAKLRQYLSKKIDTLK